MYRFDGYQLDPAARELWRDGRLLPMPRRVFDGLAYLIEHRDRAVGHDELIAALWGRVDVANAQVSQLIMQVRRAVGDDSNAQRSVRTISGFGYRWVVATTETMAADAEGIERSTERAPIAPDPFVAASDAPQTAAVAESKRPPAPAESPASIDAVARRVRIALLATAAFIATAALIGFGWHRLASTPLAHEAGRAIVVLPFDVDATEDRNAGWMRLGIMDLVASQLRRSGLPVPPSDSVVAALHATSALPEAQRLDTLKRTLGAGVLVRGTVSRVKNGWTIELAAVADTDARRRVAAERNEVMDAARQATDLLLAALGKPAAGDAGEDGPLDEYLQRAKAALLTNELDAARSILSNAPQALRDKPELRYELARIDYHAGKPDAAEAALNALLDDPAVAAEPRLRAKALRTKGWIAVDQDKGWAVAERSFDAAVQALHDTRSPADLGKALAERGAARVFLRRFDDAALDLGQARSQLEIAGDRQGLGEMNNYLGHLEFARLRITEAIPYFNAAAEISESFGSIDTLRYNLSAMLQAQMRLLRWPDALATGERLWALRERLENSGLRAATEGQYALVLVALGRQREAAEVLAAITRADANKPDGLDRFGLWARADLAWQQGRSEQAVAAAQQALAVWPPPSSLDADQRAAVALLLQRASSAGGHPLQADIGALDATAAEPMAAVYALIAQAEWTAAQGDDANAERMFKEAAATAEAQGVPDTIVLAADAYVRWLLDHGRTAEAVARAGRVGVWAEQDFDSALLQVAVYHASGESEAWAHALHLAQGLAGERSIPAALLAPPAAASSP